MPYLGSGRLVGLINYAQSNRGVRARVAKFASLRDRLPVPFLFTSGNVAMSEVGKQVFQFELCEDVLVVTPTGSLMEFRDADVRNAYNDTYRKLDDPAAKHLLIDFSQLTYFGSTFVGMLIRLARKARVHGGEAALCSLSDNMQQMMKTLMLLENTKSDCSWNEYASRDDAIARLQASDRPG